jgi:hypothetical protein
MYTMKKIIFALALFSITLNISAQLRLGVQAGASVTQPNITVSGTSISASYGSHSFIYPGIVFDYMIGNLFSIQPSFNYLQTGYSATSSYTDLLGVLQTTTNKVRINNIAVPLNLCVPIKMGKGKLELCAGPTAMLALNGTNSASVNGGSPSVADLKFGNDTLSLKQINWGTNFGVGYRLKNGLAANVGFQLPLTDIDNQSLSTRKLSVITGTLSWFLFGNKN